MGQKSCGKFPPVFHQQICLHRIFPFIDKKNPTEQQGKLNLNTYIYIVIY
jgi:hypothetical protein